MSKGDLKVQCVRQLIIESHSQVVVLTLGLVAGPTCQPKSIFHIAPLNMFVA